MHCQYYVLFRRDGLIRAADGSALIDRNIFYPPALVICEREYRIVTNCDTVFFWDELIDNDKRTLGFSFWSPPEPLRRSKFLTDSSNVVVDDEEVRIDLAPDKPHRWDCVQGFGSEVYEAMDDKTECAIIMMN